MNMKSEERLTRTVPEAARLIGVGPRAVYNLVASKELRAIMVGRKILVPISAIVEYVDGPAVR